MQKSATLKIRVDEAQIWVPPKRQQMGAVALIIHTPNGLPPPLLGDQMAGLNEKAKCANRHPPQAKGGKFIISVLLAHIFGDVLCVLL